MASSISDASSGDSHEREPVRDGALRVGDCIVRPSLNRIERDGSAHRVQSLSMQVLLYLAERVGTVVTCDELLQALWPGRHASEDAVHRRIAA